MKLKQRLEAWAFIQDWEIDEYEAKQIPLEQFILGRQDDLVYYVLKDCGEIT